MQRFIKKLKVARSSRLFKMVGYFGVALVLNSHPILSQAARSPDIVEESISPVFEEAIAKMNEGEYSVAVIHLKNLLQKDPNHLTSRVLLARAYLRQGLPENAEKELRLAMAMGADKENIFVPLGNALLMQRKYREILADIKTDLPSVTGNIEVLTLRGRALFELNRLGDAGRTFDSAIANYPGEVNPLLGRVSVAIAQGDVDLARNLLARALVLEPENAEVWFRKAELFRGQNDVEQAFFSYDNALMANPRHMRARIGRSSLAMSQKQYLRAKEDAEFVKENSGGNLSSSFILWQALLRLGQINEAEGSFQEAAQRVRDIKIEEVERQPTLLRIAGLIAYAQKDYNVALKYVSKFVETSPTDLVMQKLFGELQLRVGEAKSAERTLYSLSKKIENDAQVKQLLGEAYMALSDYDKAIDALSSAELLDPENRQITSKLAFSYIGSGRTDLALQHLTQTINVEEATLKEALVLATLQLNQGKFDSALETVQNLKHEGHNPVIANLRGAIWLAKGNLIKARGEFVNATTAEPKFVPAIYNLAQLDLNAGNVAAAEKAFINILSLQPRLVAALEGLVEVAVKRSDGFAIAGALEKLIAVNPQSKRPFVQLANHYFANNSFSEASRVVEQLTLHHFDSTESYEMTAKLHMARGKFDDAKLAFRRAKQAAGFSGSDLLRIARGQVDIADYPGAKSTLLTAVQSDESTRALAGLVRLDILLGNFDKALLRASDMRDSAADDPLGYILVAEVFSASGSIEEAIESYTTSLSIEPSQEALLGLVDAHFLKGEINQGLQVLKSWSGTHKTDLFARRELALRLISVGRFGEARPILESLNEQNSRDPMTLTALARSYQLTKDPRAEEMARAAYAIRPEWSKSAATLGWILVTSGRPLDGIHFLRQAYSRNKNHLIRYQIAVALTELGRIDEAKKELKVLLELADPRPWTEDARQLYDSIANNL